MNRPTFGYIHLHRLDGTNHLVRIRWLDFESPVFYSINWRKGPTRISLQNSFYSSSFSVKESAEEIQNLVAEHDKEFLEDTLALIDRSGGVVGVKQRNYYGYEGDIHDNF